MICHPIIISHFVLAKQQCLSSILSHFVAMFSSPMLDFCEKLVRHNLISFSAPKAMYARKMLIWFFPLLGFLLSQWDNRHTIVAQRLMHDEIWCSRLHPLRERECGIDERMYIHARRALIVCQQVNVGGGGLAVRGGPARKAFVGKCIMPVIFCSGKVSSTLSACRLLASREFNRGHCTVRERESHGDFEANLVVNYSWRWYGGIWRNSTPEIY